MKFSIKSVSHRIFKLIERKLMVRILGSGKGNSIFIIIIFFFFYVNIALQKNN